MEEVGWTMTGGENWFAVIFDRSPIPSSLSMIADSRFTRVNRAWCGFFGFSKEEAVGRTPMELNIIDDETRNRMRETYLREGTLREVEVRVRTKTGEPKDVLASVECLSMEGTEHAINLVVDITARKRSEAALQASRQHLLLLVEHVPAAVAIFDAGMNYLYASRRFLVDYGLGDRDLVGKSHYEVFPEIPARWKEIHRRCLQGATESCEEDPFPRADGKLDWIRWEIRPWFDREDRVGGIVLFSEVITRQKLAALELRQSEARFRATFEQAAVGMAHVAPNGRWLRVNQKLCDIVGFSREELLARSFQDITHPDDLEADLEFVRRMLADEIRTYAMEKRYLRQDGTIVWGNLTVSLVRDEAGRPDFFISVVEEVTARKRAEAALAQSEARLRNLFEQASDGIYLISAEHRYLDVNRRGLDLLGFSREELLRLGVADVLAPTEVARLATEPPA